ncbi:hypothetical protein GCM10020258_51310 [Sphingomonas yabuuchiae]
MVAATSVPNETEQVRGGARRARRIYASGNIAVEAANVGSIALDILIRPIEADVKILRRQLAATSRASKAGETEMARRRQSMKPSAMQPWRSSVVASLRRLKKS